MVDRMDARMGGGPRDGGDMNGDRRKDDDEDRM